MEVRHESPCPLSSAARARGAAVSEARVEEGPLPRRVCDLPPDERPRERLARHGAAALSSRELVAILIGTGRRGASALDVAEALVGAGLREMALSTLGDLEATAGLGRAKAARLLAALELGARVASGGRDTRQRFKDTRLTGRYLLPKYGASPVESFGVLLLDARYRLQREMTIAVGSLTGSLVHPREVFREALVARAVHVVLFHNHPSGDPEPSPEDVGLTQRLAAVGDVLGVHVLDHFVLGAGYVSLRERGLF